MSGRPTVDPGHPLFGLGYAQAMRSRHVEHLGEGGRRVDETPVAEEVPIALVYNRRPHAVMMGTPEDLEDFAVGFTVSEGIAAAGDIGDIVVERASHGIEVQVTIPSGDAERLGSRGRAIAGRTGCGLCGIEAIDEMLRTPPRVASTHRFAEAALFSAAGELPSLQALNSETHAVHAAAWATPEGVLEFVREDLGRHNALDKVIGAMVRAKVDAASGFVVITSRASYELVQKVATAGVPLLAAISRPTGLAIRLAEASGVTLVALLRGKSANVYAHPERLDGGGS